MSFKISFPRIVIIVTLINIVAICDTPPCNIIGNPDNVAIVKSGNRKIFLEKEYRNPAVLITSKNS